MATTASDNISNLKSVVAGLNQISENEKNGFVNLVSRYLRIIFVSFMQYTGMKALL
ncbi:putative UTP--glucose-1-phosphate uridylyltransferase [Lupinus albus]|uniref:Putative UTP--glucose-1-phosphate uridylyltransferase n=1 Tax=Lupinus albus TaxID=3870 RepID=A0A6A4NUA1_LUPAL|nr:putative UTP--glucose-1-phosphate uridylyltransferase [Lupinus albus]